MVAALVIYVMATIGLCVGGDFTISGLIAYILGIGVAIFALANKDIH